MIPGDAELVGRCRIEGLGHDVEKRARIREGAVAMGDTRWNAYQDVVSAARDQHLRAAESFRILSDVEENHLRFGGRGEEPDVLLLEVIVEAFDVSARVDDGIVHLNG